MWPCICSFRGDKFRVEFARLGEVRSLIPQHVHVMALTATATKSTRKLVIKRLSMINPVIFSITPNKSNTVYNVVEKKPLEDVVVPIAQQLKTHRTKSDRVIIYCRYCREVADFYETFKQQLGKYFTSPTGFTDLAKYRLVDMYTSVTVDSVKEQIVKSFCDPNGNLRVIICTVAFGMGLDCQNVCHIIHWGPSTDLEGYVQETGRGGRDGKICFCTIMYKKADQMHTEKLMVDYCKNVTECRRRVLFKDFDGFENLTFPVTECKCCDVCKQSCKCHECT